MSEDLLRDKLKNLIIGGDWEKEDDYWGHSYCVICESYGTMNGSRKHTEDCLILKIWKLVND